MGLDRGSKLRCTFVLGGSKGRCFQRLQITIDPVLRPFVPFCSQFSFQLCSLVTPLVPALQEGGLVGINETGSWSFPARVGDVSRSDPPLKSSLAHPQRPGNLPALHALCLQLQDLFIPSRSLGLTGLLRLLDGLCSGRTPFFCTTQLGKRPGDLHRDACGQILDQMPAVTHLPRLWSAFANSRNIFRGAIAADHLKRGMLFQPGLDALSRAVGDYEGFPLVALENFSGSEQKTLIIAC